MIIGIPRVADTLIIGSLAPNIKGGARSKYERCFGLADRAAEEWDADLLPLPALFRRLPRRVSFSLWR